MNITPPTLPADLESGLRRLRLGAMRRLAPELLVVAKTQRWKPEELLRTLVEAEVTSRDASNARSRMKAAAFPVRKTIDEFDVAASSVPRATFEYLTGLEWIDARENLCLVGPAGTGKSHLLVALGHHAVDAGKRVRYFSATELVETLYRGLADNSVGRGTTNGVGVLVTERNVFEGVLQESLRPRSPKLAPRVGYPARPPGPGRPLILLGSRKTRCRPRSKASSAGRCRANRRNDHPYYVVVVHHRRYQNGMVGVR